MSSTPPQPPHATQADLSLAQSANPSLIAPPSQAPVTHRSAFLAHPLLVAIAGPIVVTLLVFFGGAALQKFSGFPLGRGQASVVIDSPDLDANVNGSPEIRGDAKNLRPGQMVWSFNSPEDSGKAYPDLGPCAVKESTFSCKLTALSIDPKSDDPEKQKYTLWVVVVDSEDAVINITTKAQLNGIKPYIPIDRDGPGHVESDTAIDSVDVTCVRANGCPVQGEPAGGADSVTAAITSPKDGETYRTSSITVTGIGGPADRLYLFDYDGGQYTRDTDSALPVDRSGNWRFSNEGLEQGSLRLVLVNATSECERKISAMKADKDDTYVWTSFPAQCAQIDQVTVQIS